MKYTDRLDDAFIFAHRLHREQKRKASHVPYISHLMAVAALVAEYGGSEDQVIAALLHDVVEDQGGLPRLAEIREKFGEAVARMVEGCTDSEAIPRPPWKQRKATYIDHLQSAPLDVLLVSACDKLHNSRCIVEGVREAGPGYLERFSGGRDGTLWYYRALQEAFAASGLPSTLLFVLQRNIDEMHQLAGETEPSTTG